MLTKKKQTNKKRIQTFQTKCLRKLLRQWLKTNDWVQSKINFHMGAQEPFLATVKRQKLAWFRNGTRHDSLSKTVLQGTLEAGRRCGWQKKSWMDNIEEWTSLPMPELLTRASCRKKKLEENLCRFVPHVPPMTQWVKGL